MCEIERSNRLLWTTPLPQEYDAPQSTDWIAPDNAIRRRLMGEEKRRRILPILGWVVAVVLLILFLGSRYEISFHKKSALDQPLTSTSPAGEPFGAPSTATKARPGAPQAVPAQPRVLSTQELFDLAGPAVVLIEVYDQEGHKRGLGSGFVVSSDGSAITNYHVIRGAYRATAKFSDGTFAPVSGIVAYDPDHDVAVIRVQGASPPTLQLGNAEDLRVGDHVVAIGSPLGLQNTVSEGIVSGLRGNLIQMSAPISPGSSGGPVLNSTGKVVGVSVATVMAGQNLNFAVPINWAKRYLGSAPARSLAEVATENTVVQDVLKGSLSVPAGQARTWQIQVNPNLMSDAELHGEIRSTGGFGGQVTLSLYYGDRLIYNCPRQTQCAIHEDLSQSGSYTLFLDNRQSLMFAREVSGQIELRYVK
jgi:S1-C subfamily serine protease